MSNEIVKHQPAAPATLDGAVRFAQLLADADLLPRQFVGKPANVLYAVEYGRTLGITPVAAITGIHVIEGKPSASSGLIGALVRKAGHKLRVKSDGMSWATAQIVRADDPDFTYECTWNLERAAQAGLCKVEGGKPVARDRNDKPTSWEKYPAAMLKARAITEVARDACEDVLFGLHYTPEELGAVVNQDGEPVEATVQQLRRVPAGETDQWTTPVPPQGGEPEPHTEAQVLANRAAKAATRAEVNGIAAEAKDTVPADARVKAPDTNTLEALRDYLARCWKALPEKAAAEQQDGQIVDVEVVETVQPADDADDYAAAVAELRAAAEAARLYNFEEGAEQALGCPITQASTEAIRALAAQIRPAA